MKNITFSRRTFTAMATLAAASVANAHLQDNAVDGRVWDESASLTGVNLTATGALTGATLAISGAATFAGDVTLGNAAADALHLLAKLGSSTVQKTTPVDADQLILGDSAASDQLVRMTRAQFVRALLNIQTAHVAGTQTYGAASWTSVTSLQVTITPRSTDARILLVALINGGIATNVIPDETVVTVNYRFAPSKSAADAEAHLREVFAGLEVAITDSAEGARPGLDRAEAQAFVAAVGSEPRPKYGWTDVARFSELGVPAVNYGPGDPSKAHADDENVPVGQIYACETGLREWLTA